MSEPDCKDFENYVEYMMKKSEKNFVVKLAVFSQLLYEYVSKGRRCHADDIVFYPMFQDIDLHELILQIHDKGGLHPMKTLTVVKYILMTAHCLKVSIGKDLTNDFPKFLGERGNTWRYLMHLISKYWNEVSPDFTTRFLVACACFVEVTTYCFELKQYDMAKQDSLIWVCMVLHYFGKRFNNDDEEGGVVLRLNPKIVEDIDKACHQGRGGKKGRM